MMEKGRLGVGRRFKGSIIRKMGRDKRSRSLRNRKRRRRRKKKILKTRNTKRRRKWRGTE